MIFFRWSWQSEPLRQPWQSLFLALFGCFWIGVGAYINYIKVDLIENGIQVEGIVVDIHREADGLATPEFYFETLDGKKIFKKSRTSSNVSDYKIDDTAVIYYSPENPETFVDGNVRRLWFIPALFVSLGTLLIIGSALSWKFRKVISTVAYKG